MKKFKIENIRPQNIFKTPEGYFDKLPLAIQKKLEAHQSLSLSQIPKVQVFMVPANYFQELPQHIQEKIVALNGLEALTTAKQSAFQVPANYFAELPQKIQDKIRALNTQQIEDFSNETVFTTPDDYFEDLAGSIQEKITRNKRESAWNWAFPPTKALVYALPLVLLLVLSVSGVLYLWNPQGNTLDDTVANNPQEENPLDSSFKNQPENALTQEETDELAEKMDQIIALREPEGPEALALQENNIEGLQEISDEEIVAYLDLNLLEETDPMDLIIESDILEASKVDDDLSDLLIDDPYADMTQAELAALTELFKTELKSP